MYLSKEDKACLEAGELKPKIKKNKFGAEQMQIGKYLFRSKLEGRRYIELCIMKKIGLISNLKVDSLTVKEIKPFILQEGFRHKSWKRKVMAITYTPDFIYNAEEKIIYEDCKGMRTETYKLKVKMLLFQHPDINFIET